MKTKVKVIRNKISNPVGEIAKKQSEGVCFLSIRHQNTVQCCQKYTTGNNKKPTKFSEIVISRI